MRKSHFSTLTHNLNQKNEDQVMGGVIITKLLVKRTHRNTSFYLVLKAHFFIEIEGQSNKERFQNEIATCQLTI